MGLHPEVMEEVAPGLGLGAGQDSLWRGRRHSGCFETEVGRGRGKLWAHDAVYQRDVLWGVWDLGVVKIGGHSLYFDENNLIEDTGLYFVSKTFILAMLTLKTPSTLIILSELCMNSWRITFLQHLYSRSLSQMVWSLFLVGLHQNIPNLERTGTWQSWKWSVWKRQWTIKLSTYYWLFGQRLS